jgi:hypothetical protein
LRISRKHRTGALFSGSILCVTLAIRTVESESGLFDRFGGYWSQNNSLEFWLPAAIGTKWSSECRSNQEIGTKLVPTHARGAHQTRRLVPNRA